MSYKDTFFEQVDHLTFMNTCFLAAIAFQIYEPSPFRVLSIAFDVVIVAAGVLLCLRVADWVSEKRSAGGDAIAE